MDLESLGTVATDDILNHVAETVEVPAACGRVPPATPEQLDRLAETFIEIGRYSRGFFHAVKIAGAPLAIAQRRRTQDRQHFRFVGFVNLLEKPENPDASEILGLEPEEVARESGEWARMKNCGSEFRKKCA